jgi:signal transduction histidine kinase
MTTDTDEIRWTILGLQLALNFSFSVLLLSMAIRTIQLKSTCRNLKEEIRDQKFNERGLLLSKKQAEAASRAKSSYLTNLSHEFRTPMNVIVGFSELLIDEPLTEEQREYINTIYISSKHLLGLINNVLDLSKIESGKLEILTKPISLELFIQQIEKIISPAAQTKDLDFNIIIDETVPGSLDTDEVHLRQCLINLLFNAIKFTPFGAVNLHVCSGEDHICFEVIDSGIGIAPGEIKTIFEPFMQADKMTSNKFSGTGLGLSITRQLVELMGGTITVVSQQGQGSTFTLRLPCTDCVSVTA